VGPDDGGIADAAAEGAGAVAFGVEAGAAEGVTTAGAASHARTKALAATKRTRPRSRRMVDAYPRVRWNWSVPPRSFRPVLTRMT